MSLPAAESPRYWKWAERSLYARSYIIPQPDASFVIQYAPFFHLLRDIAQLGGQNALLERNPHARPY